jgi:hypothetical protein
MPASFTTAQTSARGFGGAGILAPTSGPISENEIVTAPSLDFVVL